MFSVWQRLPVIVQAILAGALLVVVGSAPWAVLSGAKLKYWSAVPWSV